MENVRNGHNLGPNAGIAGESENVDVLLLKLRRFPRDFAEPEIIKCSCGACAIVPRDYTYTLANVRFRDIAAAFRIRVCTGEYPIYGL